MKKVKNKIIKKNYFINNLGFTLVELIVVITILSILGVLAFIWFQKFTINARDSVRTTDIKNIQKSLSFYAIKTWKFPDPTNWTKVTYSWATVWIQWVFWDSMLTNVWIINKKPLDPLKSVEYSYSITWDNQEYQLIGALESSELAKNNFLFPQTYADYDKARAYSAWTYNWLALRVSTWWQDYVLALPSITARNLNQTDVTQILWSRSLVYNNYWSFPSNFSWAFNSDNAFNFYPNKLVVYTDLFETLNDPKNQVILLKNIQDAYNWTIVVADDTQIENIVDTEIDLAEPSNKAKVLACSVINFSLRYFVHCNDIDYITFYIINVLHLDINDLPWDKVNAVYRSENWDLRFWTNWWVWHYNWTSWTIYNTWNSPIVSNIILAIAQDSLWAMWFWTNQWISVYDWDDWSSINTWNSDLLHNHVLQIYAGSEGTMRIWTNIWVSSYNAWVWEDYTKKKIWMSHNQVNSIYEDNLWNIWFWTKVWLDKYKDGVITSYTTTEWLPSNWITYITQDLNNNIRLWTTRWVSKYNRTTFTTLDNANTAWKLPSDNITYIFQNELNSDLRIWTDNWAVKYIEPTNSWTLYNTSNQLSWNLIRSINQSTTWNIIIISDWWVDTLTD